MIEETDGLSREDETVGTDLVRVSDDLRAHLRESRKKG